MNLVYQPRITATAIGANANANTSLRDEIKRLLHVHQIARSRIVADSGVSNSVLSLWLNDKYRGDTHKINDRMYSWLQLFYQQEQMQAQAQAQAQANQQIQQETLQPHLSHAESVAALSSSSLSSSSSASGMNLLTIIIDAVYHQERYQDCFLWNLSDTSLTPQLFAQTLCQDVQLNSAFVPLIVAQIKAQIMQHLQAASVPVSISTCTSDYHHHAQLAPQRLLKIKLDISHSGFRLVDELLWNIVHAQSSPEEFARITALELGLDGEFTNLIALSIRAQIQAALQQPTEANWFHSSHLDLFEFPSNSNPNLNSKVLQSIAANHLHAVAMPYARNETDEQSFEHFLPEDELVIKRRRVESDKDVDRVG